MKTLLILLMGAMLCLAPEVNNNDPYCEGWEAGYCEGWRDVKGQFVPCPVTPVCPVAEAGKTRYQDGYNRAYRTAYAKAKRN